MEKLNKWREELVQESRENEGTFRQISKEIEFKPNKTDRRITTELNDDLINQLFGSHRGKTNVVVQKSSKRKDKPTENRSLARSRSEQANAFRLTTPFESVLKPGDSFNSRSNQQRRDK